MNIFKWWIECFCFKNETLHDILNENIQTGKKRTKEKFILKSWTVGVIMTKMLLAILANLKIKFAIQEYLHFKEYCKQTIKNLKGPRKVIKF